MRRLALVVTNPPFDKAQANHGLFPVVRGGKARLVKSGAQREFLSAVGAQVAHGVRLAGWAPLTGPCEVWLRFYFGSWRPDTDAYVKPVLDALQIATEKRPYGGGVYMNDSRVVDYHVKRRVDSGSPRIGIEVAELDPFELEGTAAFPAASAAQKRAFRAMLPPAAREKFNVKALTSSKRDFRGGSG
jgi:hypothetical protein